MRILAIILIGMLSLTGCVADGNNQDLGQESEDVYRIGVYQPLSGEDAEEAKAEIEGIELAHKVKSQVLGKKIELVYADNKSDIFKGKLAAQKLVNNEVDLVLGSYGNVMSMTGGKYFSEAGIPAIAITCSNPLVTKGNPYYFRVGTVDAYQSPVIASFVFSELKAKNIAIVKIVKDDFGTALAQGFSEKLEELDESIKIINLEIREDMANMDIQLEKLKESKADLVYMPIGPDRSLAIMEGAKDINYSPQFVGTSLWRDDCMIEDGGRLVEGIIFTDYLDGASSINEKAEEFLANYKKYYGDETPSYGAALGYDAYMIAISMLEAQAQSEEEVSLQGLLAQLFGYEGVTGSISFNEDGDPIKPMRISTIENGEFIEKTIAEPDEDLLEGNGKTEDSDEESEKEN